MLEATGFVVFGPLTPSFAPTSITTRFGRPSAAGRLKSLNPAPLLNSSRVWTVNSAYPDFGSSCQAVTCGVSPVPRCTTVLNPSRRTERVFPALEALNFGVLGVSNTMRVKSPSG